MAPDEICHDAYICKFIEIIVDGYRSDVSTKEVIFPLPGFLFLSVYLFFSRVMQKILNRFPHKLEEFLGHGSSKNSLRFGRDLEKWADPRNIVFTVLRGIINVSYWGKKLSYLRD